MFNTQILAGSSGQGGETQQSLKFNDDESQYLSWTPAAAGNRKTMTLSVWAKRGNLGSERIIFTTDAAANDTSRLQIRFGGGNDLRLAGQSTTYLATSALFRDVSSWYHIVLAINTTEATASDRLKLWVNGEQITAFSSTSYPSQNSDLPWNLAQLHGIGSDAGGIGSSYYDGYLSDIHFIDGQALDATSFGQFTNGYWKKKDYAGSYGTNGFHLTFQDDVVSEGFNTVTYRGTGADQSISGLGFEPDFVWAKERSSTSTHMLADSVRGAGKQLESSNTGAEITSSAGSRTLSSFDADGFSVEPNNQTNQSGETYVAWAWDAGSGSAASNTDGSITSTVKANPDYGFSITSFVGNGTLNATTGHGLSSTPEMVLVKNRSTTVGWLAWHKDLSGATYRMDLNGSGAEYNDGNGALQGVSSSLLTLGSLNAVNQNSANMIAYCWHSVAGYSSIGSYSGNGSTQTITTGFAPAFVMIKSYAGAAVNWNIYDNTRKPTNPNDLELYADLSSAEFDSGRNINFTSTGFELDTANYVNNSGVDYIYMAFADTREAAFWKDVSGQGNHWTPNNLDYRDSVIDSPANNFAVMNPLMGNSSYVHSEGNTKVNYGSASWLGSQLSTVGMTSGKHYWEVYVNSASSSVRALLGIESDANNYLGSTHIGNLTNSVAIYSVGTIFYEDGSGTTDAEWVIATSDVVMFAYDADNGTLWIGKDGTWWNGATAAEISAGTITNAMTSGLDTSLTWLAGCTVRDGAAVTFNFGQDSTFAGATTAGGNADSNGVGDFKYAVPSGFLALATANLPTPTIVDGSEYFNTVLYTGTGASTLSITGVGFQPDWVWAKKRSASDNHAVADVVRGVTKSLFPSTTGAESTDVNGLQSFDSDGFTIGSGSGSGVWGGNSGATYVAWNWKAGGTAVANTDGSITSQVSANVDAGFSIVSYTGTGSAATVGHGLGVVPSIVIWKRRNGTTNWSTQSTLWADQKELTLNSTGALSATDSRLSTQSSWTSTTLDLGTYGDQNGSGGTYIAYCFANTEGFSKAGSYVANQSTDGTFIYLGFRPAFFLAKNISRSQEWIMMNNKTTDPYNPQDGSIQPNSSAAEGTGNEVDFLSNGVKLRNSGGGLNYASGDTFIYLAFAENPFKYANAR